jgi:hypothetical protein
LRTDQGTGRGPFVLATAWPVSARHALPLDTPGHDGHLRVRRDVAPVPAWPDWPAALGRLSGR